MPVNSSLEQPELDISLLELKFRTWRSSPTEQLYLSMLLSFHLPQKRPSCPLRLLVEAARTPRLWQVQDPRITGVPTGCSAWERSLLINYAKLAEATASAGGEPRHHFHPQPWALPCSRSRFGSPGDKLKCSASVWCVFQGKVSRYLPHCSTCATAGADGQRHHHNHCQGCWGQDPALPDAVWQQGPGGTFPVLVAELKMPVQVSNNSCHHPWAQESKMPEVRNTSGYLSYQVPLL